MTEVPAEFRVRIKQHNRHCWLAACMSLAGACLFWTLYLSPVTALALTFETVRTGDTNILNPPSWLLPGLLGFVMVLFVWTAIDRWRRRYQPVPERPIIGWHLVPDVLLMPARMTFAIWDHIRARIVLSRHEREEAWRLLQNIAGSDRASAATLAFDFPDAAILTKLLMALQLSGWIDLHPGDDGWFYRVSGDQQETVKRLTIEP